MILGLVLAVFCWSPAMLLVDRAHPDRPSWWVLLRSVGYALLVGGALAGAVALAAR